MFTEIIIILVVEVNDENGILMIVIKKMTQVVIVTQLIVIFMITVLITVNGCRNCNKKKNWHNCGDRLVRRRFVLLIFLINDRS